MSKTIERIKRAYASCGLKVPIILASSPPVGAFLAPILAHAEKIDDATIRQAQRDAKTLAYGKPGAALIAKHRGALSHDHKSGQGAHKNQPGGNSVKLQRAWRQTRDDEFRLLSRGQPSDVGVQGNVFRATNEHVRVRIHTLFKQRVKYHDYFEASEHIVCWPNKRFAVLSEKPERILLNNNRQLHSTEKLAVKFADGWGVAAVNGIVIPTIYLHQRQKLTVKVIQGTTNAEVRRALIELFGYDRWLVESKATLLCEDVDRDGQTRKLWGLLDEPVPNWQLRGAFADARQRTLNLLEVFNSTPELDGTFKRYYLQVPGNIMTIQQALNWMVDDRETWDVEPLIET